jgi:pyridoxine 5-phosphate synthase
MNSNPASVRTKLSVNVNKIAFLRNSRNIDIPNVVKFARIALDAGADGITIHPRPDQRHVRADDVPQLARMMREYPDHEFNIEGNPFHNLIDAARMFAKFSRLHQVTLVPDETGQFTSDHGWDLARDGEKLRPVIEEFKSLGARVSLFMDPVPETMAAAKAIGADRVELYTEPYAKAYGSSNELTILSYYSASAEAAANAGLDVNAGHDLNTDNLPMFVRAVKPLHEVSIGHALVADAIEYGLSDTVRRYQRALEIK